MGKRIRSADADMADRASKAGKSADKSGKTQRVIAMSHPLRARVLRLLVERGVMSPAELSRALQASLRGVSYHVHRLEELECAELVYTRPVRGAMEHFYRATERPMIDTDEFADFDPILAEDLVLHTFQRMIDDFADSRKAAMVGFDENFHLTRTPLIVDREGLKEGMDALERCRLELSESERRSAERRQTSGEPGIPVSGCLAYFKVPSASLEN
jgi:DNA-binding transcriptional ArsR family regulator